MDLSSISKAIGGGLAGAVIAVAARYGFHAAPEVVSAVSVVVTAFVGYAVAHLAVYFAPKNTER